MDDLKSFGRACVDSLWRRTATAPPTCYDIFETRQIHGLLCRLSTNGTLIDKTNIDAMRRRGL